MNCCRHACALSECLSHEAAIQESLASPAEAHGSTVGACSFLFWPMGWADVAASLCECSVVELREKRSEPLPEGSDSDSVVDCIEEADALHSETEGECSQGSEGSSRVWWAKLLRQHLAELGWSLPDALAEPVSLVSCCSGACSEAVVLEDSCVCSAVANAASILSTCSRVLVTLYQSLHGGADFLCL